MTRQETVTIAIPLALLLANVAVYGTSPKPVRFFLFLLALYWFSVWFTGRMWHL